METYFETITPETDQNALTACFIRAHETLEDAIKWAESHNITTISEIGGCWSEYEKCEFCGDWFDTNELNTKNICERCAVAIKDHNHP